jgi:structural maintenance of chromosome 1
MFLSSNTAHRKASASVLAISERQALETLSRDEKTAARTLAQLKAKHEDMERNRERLRGEEETQQANKSEVCIFRVGVFYVLTVFRKLEDKFATLQGDLARSKQEYDNQQSERTRIRYFASLSLHVRQFTVVLQSS